MNRTKKMDINNFFDFEIFLSQLLRIDFLSANKINCNQIKVIKKLLIIIITLI